VNISSETYIVTNLEGVFIEKKKKGYRPTDRGRGAVKRNLHRILGLSKKKKVFHSKRRGEGGPNPA